jgi:cell wall-associated NlpC family hydrolase
MLALAGIWTAALGAALLTELLSVLSSGNGCAGGEPSAATIALQAPGRRGLVGATEYGGPGDPTSGTTAARGDNLLRHPDTYAELGGLTWQTATALGGLAYMTPLRVTWGGRSVIAYKRDFGLGGGPVAGLPRVIDLWWQLAGRLGIPYQGGLWSGPVRIAPPPVSGAGSVLGQTVSASAAAPSSLAPSSLAGQDPAACAPGSVTGVSLTPGSRARLLPDGLAAAPADAPPAVKAMIAAGNQIVGKPYVYGGAHGLPLPDVAPAYDCSSSVEHVLYGARLLPPTYGAGSGQLESFGVAGPGSWVTLYASSGHVFVYVAGLRWDTWNAAGPGDGPFAIGWHPLIRGAAGFVARHPVGL